MKNTIVAALPIVLLASCSGGMGSGPLTPTQAKQDNASLLTSLPTASQHTILFCQAQLQHKLGGTIDIIAAPALQTGDVEANATTNVIMSRIRVVYDRVDGTTVTSSSRACHLQSKNLVVRPSHAE